VIKFCIVCRYGKSVCVVSYTPPATGVPEANGANAVPKVSFAAMI
jgi:hypothetical protein